MNLKDALDYADGVFDCRLGFPGRYSDGPERSLKPVVFGRQEYATLRFSHHPEDGNLAVGEHFLAAMMVNWMDRARLSCRTSARLPVLLWRYKDRIRLGVDERRTMTVTTRLHIEGCESYGEARVKESQPPTHVRLLIDNDPPEAVILGIRQEAEA